MHLPLKNKKQEKNNNNNNWKLSYLARVKIHIINVVSLYQIQNGGQNGRQK